MKKLGHTLSKKKVVLLISLIVLVGASLFIILEKKQVLNVFSPDTNTNSSEPKTSSTAPTAQEDFTDGDERPVTRDDKNEGIVEDTGGSVTNIPEETQWSLSKDGAITVYEPAKNTLLTNGNTLSGTSSLSTVSFRLIDDVSGVIAQGTLSVMNGKFSGVFSFTTSGTNGRLDIFSADPNGVESSNVEIAVRFR